MCLDVLRALAQERDAAQAVVRRLAEETAALPGARAAADFIGTALAADHGEARARAAVGRLASLAAAAALQESAAPTVAEGFARMRLSAAEGTMYGTSDVAPDQARRLLERALPPD